ncbi:MAG: hypothetical protein IPJ85_13640 [Flavobacteriales bacterium]|nr:hypothetical protein [Flavobacteriales bacterium]
MKKIKGSEIFRIENGKYIIVDVVAARPQNERHMFNIVGFSYYLPQKEMYFVKELTQEQKRLRDPRSISASIASNSTVTKSVPYWN